LSRSHLRLIIKLTGNGLARFGQLFCGRRQINNREQAWHTIASPYRLCASASVIGRGR